MGLPKCGTTSFQKYFLQAGENSCHQVIGEPSFGPNATFIAKIMKSNFEKGVPLLSGDLSRCNVFTQLDGHNIWPQISFLATLCDQYPGASYILNTRNTTNHVNSIMNSNNLASRIADFGTPNFQPVGDLRQSIHAWVESHNHNCRSFFKRRPHLHFVEIDIEDSNLPTTLSKFLNKPVDYFPKENRGTHIT